MSATTTPIDTSDDASGQVLVGCVIGIILTVTFFTLRITSKWLHERKFDLSDAFLAASVPITLAIDILMLWCRDLPVGLGHHADPTNPIQFKAAMQALFAVQCTYAFALAFIKLSFLLLYLRLFTGKLYRSIIYFWCGLTLAWAVANFFLTIFQCKPIKAFWTLELRPEATCSSLPKIFVATWIPNIFSDLVILTLPQVHVWKLQVGLRIKVALACTFSVGVFAMAANIVRFTTFWQIVDTDFSYTIAPLALWTALNLTASTVCASLVTMRPLLMMIIRRLKKAGSWTGGSNRDKKSEADHHRLFDVQTHSRDHHTMNIVSDSRMIGKQNIMVTNDTYIESKPRDLLSHSQ